VVLRPSAGIGINTGKSLDSRDPDAALGIEPIGFVRYTEADFSRYWGLSLLVTVGEDKGEGVGLLLRYKNYAFGLTWRDENKVEGIESDDTYLFLGLDLYQLLHDKKERYKKYKKKLRDNLLKHVKE